jgi:hypothetical protein
LRALLLVAPKGAAENLTLEEAIRLALANNERAKIAKHQVDAAEGELESARSELLPSLTFGAAVTAQPYADKAMRFVTGSGTLTLRQPLLNPSAIPSYARARHSLDAAKHDATEARRIFAYDTARAFIQVLAPGNLQEALWIGHEPSCLRQRLYGLRQHLFARRQRLIGLRRPGRLRCATLQEGVEILPVHIGEHWMENALHRHSSNEPGFYARAR